MASMATGWDSAAYIFMFSIIAEAAYDDHVYLAGVHETPISNA